MAVVRFSRDRRGYEHVYLVQSDDRGRSRILYWFRTPPGVKVGRSPFDADTRRDIEARHPGISFDWAQIVAAKMPPPAPAEGWRERRRAERAMKRARASESAQPSDVGSLSDTRPTDVGPLSDTGPTDVGSLSDTGPTDVGPLSDTRPTDVGPLSDIAANEAEVAPVPRAGRGRRRRRRGARRRPAADQTAGPVEPVETERLDQPGGTRDTSTEE